MGYARHSFVSRDDSLHGQHRELFRNVHAILAIERVAPLHAARTSQRDVPTNQVHSFNSPPASQNLPRWWWCSESGRVWRRGRLVRATRSEERRVGKECSSVWW